MTARRPRTGCRTTTAASPLSSASPRSTPVPTLAHPTDRAIRVLRSPR